LVRPILTAGRRASKLHPHPDTRMAWFPDYPLYGLIGQTWANATYAKNRRYQGEVDDYIESRAFSTDSLFS